jgi:hypothetical protein
MQWRGNPNLPKEPKLKTAIALLAVLLVAACAAGTPAGSTGGQVKSDGGNVVDSQGSAVVTGKF